MKSLFCCGVLDDQALTGCCVPPPAQEREREKELALIKAQYLGAEKKKKKVLKGAEKFKFNFDWEAGDDTSRDLNPLYNQTHGV